MKELLKNTIKIGTTEVALILVGVIKNKYLAVTVGPIGYGMYSILDSFFGFFLAFSGGWLAIPTMKYISELRSKNNEGSIQSILNFCFSVTFLSSLFFVALFFIFSDFFLTHFISKDIAFEYYALFAASFLGVSLNSVMQSYFQGMLFVNETIFRKIVLRIFDVASAVILVLLFGLTGFFLNVFVVAFFGLFIFIYKSSKHKPKIVWPDLKDALHKKVITFGGLNLFIGIFSLISMHLQKLIVLRFLDIATLGLYRAALTFTGYLAIVGTSSHFFMDSKAAEELSNIERNKRLNDYTKLIVISSIIIFIPGILFSDTIIHLLYSKKFLELSPFLYVFIFAQYFLNIQLGIQANIVGLEKFKIYTFATLLAYAIIVIIPYFFLKEYGIKVLGIASIITSIEQILILSLYLYLKNKIAFSKYSLFLIFAGILLLIMAVFLIKQTLTYQIVFYTISVFITYFLFTKNDKEKILLFINTRIRPRKKTE